MLISFELMGWTELKEEGRIRDPGPRLSHRDPDAQVPTDRMKRARSLPPTIEGALTWDAILPKRGSTLDTHFEPFCEVGLGDASLSDEDKHEWLRTKNRDHFVLQGGGCRTLANPRPGPGYR